MRRRPALVLAALFALAVPRAASAEVWVVDQQNGPGTDFTSLVIALTLAVDDGDIVLLRPGSYSHAHILGKGITLIGDPGPSGQRPVVKSLSVRDLPAGKSVTVRGVDGHDNPGNGTIGLVASLWIQNCAGPVFVEDFRTEQVASVYSKPTPIWVNASDRVVLTRVDVRGPGATPTQGIGGQADPAPGVRVVDSTVAMYDCRAEGGPGSDALGGPFATYPAFDGAPGVDFVSGTLVTNGGEFRGGDGGDGLLDAGQCLPSSSGGAGLVLGGAWTRLDTAAIGGAGGTDSGGCPQVGVDGAVVLRAGGAETVVADSYRSYVVDSPLRVGQAGTTTFVGVPGEFVGLLLSLASSGDAAPTFKGTLVPGAPLFFAGLGTVPASGVIQFTVPVPAIGGLEGIVLQEQALVAGADGFGLLSSPSHVVLVDAGI
ncbi:MAG: hypothetical protein ACF8XB_08285 [Planctomycetota bacterium JB042]